MKVEWSASVKEVTQNDFWTEVRLPFMRRVDVAPECLQLILMDVIITDKWICLCYLTRAFEAVLI